jgi:hypothetical protein
MEVERLERQRGDLADESALLFGRYDILVISKARRELGSGSEKILLTLAPAGTPRQKLISTRRVNGSFSPSFALGSGLSTFGVTTMALAATPLRNISVFTASA